MFDFLKKELTLSTIANGSVIDISLVPDKVFSKKILGDGFAVIPSDGNFCSPANGTISDITKTLHAYCITSDDGLEILVHIGLDTVELGGKYFEPQVNPGERVKKGSPLVTADLKSIRDAGYNTCSMVVITNSDKLKNFSILESPSAKSGDKAMLYKI